MYSRLFSGIAVLVLLLMCGCESSIKERIVDAPPKVQEFDGSIDRVYAAAQRAFRRLDFVLVRSSIGRIEAASSVHRSQAFDNARQVTAQVRIRESVPGKCEIEMWLNEEVAGDQFGGTYRKPLPEHEFYGTYFTMLQEVLTELRAQDALEKK
jgi:hypothetical protein